MESRGTRGQWGGAGSRVRREAGGVRMGRAHLQDIRINVVARGYTAISKRWWGWGFVVRAAEHAPHDV